MSELAAMIFDVDGTLADTEEFHRIAFNRAFANAGLDWQWSPQLYHDLLAVTGGKERIRYYLEKYNPDFKAPNDLVAFIKQLHESKTEIYTTMLANGEIQLRPGVKRLLEQARAEGVRLAIATTTTLANIEGLIVNALGEEAMQWFDVIAAGDVVPAKKPAPDIYVYALQHLQLSADQCIAFEDSENGIRSSMGANLKTIITFNHYTHDHDFNSAAIILNHMGEPDTPFEVTQGDARGRTYLDLDLVRQLHQQ
ncbi:HAD family hydrolase [Kaarinaea lacus]